MTHQEQDDYEEDAGVSSEVYLTEDEISILLSMISHRLKYPKEDNLLYRKVLQHIAWKLEDAL